MKLTIMRMLRRRVERFLREWTYDVKGHEFGGFLIESRKTGAVNDVFIATNISDKPKIRYKRHKNAKPTAEKYASSKRASVVACWHSHPTPCIMSAADRSNAEYHNPLIYVTITPVSTGYHREYQWYACKGITPVQIEWCGR